MIDVIGAGCGSFLIKFNIYLKHANESWAGNDAWLHIIRVQGMDYGNLHLSFNFGTMKSAVTKKI